MPEPIAPTPMLPNVYLRLRREARGLSLDDLALMTETDPAVSARRRAEWWSDIEQGVADISVGNALRLQQVLSFDWKVFVQLNAIAEGIAANPPVICRVCACSEWDACEDEGGVTCGWAEPGFCTTCAARAPTLAAAA